MVMRVLVKPGSLDTVIGGLLESLRMLQCTDADQSIISYQAGNESICLSRFALDCSVRLLSEASADCIVLTPSRAALTAKAVTKALARAG